MLVLRTIKMIRTDAFVNKLNIPEECLIKYAFCLSESYLPNPYHNETHGADTMCTTLCLIKSEKFKGYEYYYVLAVLLAAAAHDVEHPGTNNLYQVNKGTKLALKYNDVSVLENHHCAVGWRILTEAGILTHIPAENRS